MVRKEKPAIAVCPISFNHAMEFRNEPLQQILNQLEPGDGILLETTGGLRDSVMYILLLSRVLQYAGHPLVQAVYSNLAEGKITDISSLLEMFDLVGGLHELTSFGSTKALRAYYETQEKEPCVEEVISAMEALYEAITLCRTALIDDSMDRFNAAINDAANSADPLMRLLLPAFRKSFGKDKRLRIPGLIRWCVQSGMLQQALTVYTERIPAYMIKRGDILRITASQIDGREYEDPYAVQFMQGFLGLSANSKGLMFIDDSAVKLRSYIQFHSEEILRTIETGVSLRVPHDIETGIENLCLLTRLYFPQGDTFLNPDRTKKLPSGKETLEEVAECIRTACVKGPRQLINVVGTMDSRLLNCLLEQEGALPGRKVNYHIITLEHLEELLPDSGYEVLINLDDMKIIARDYLYIKALRNMTNHANHEETEEQRGLMAYLEGYGYPQIGEIGSVGIAQCILDGLDHMRPKKKRAKSH